MPHLLIETSIKLSNAQVDKLLHEANSCLLKSGLFTEEDIKSRLYGCQQSMVGLGKSDMQFMHIRLEIMEGRPDLVKQQLIADVNRSVEVLLRVWGINQCQITTQLTDIPKALYLKVTI